MFKKKRLTTQLKMELEVLKILNYFLDMRHDYLLTNLRNEFIELLNEHQLFQEYKENNLTEEDITKILN